MKKINDPKNIKYVGAIVQAVLYAIAGDSFFTHFGWLAGFGVGMVVNWSMAIAASRVSGIQARSRRRLAYFALFFLFCLSPVIICSTLGWSVANFAWAIACDLSILLTGATAGQSLFDGSKPQATRSGRSKSLSEARAKKSERSKSLSKSAANVACRYAPQCDRTFKSQNAANAHARNCGFKPIMDVASMPAIRVEKSK